MKSLIINADDFGLTEGICRGILELLEVGAIGDTTAMVAVEGAVARAVAHGGRELEGKMGLHLQLTSGRPVADVREVPTLVDEAGLFKGKRQLEGLSAAEVDVEWRRQVKVFEEAFGFWPSHLDSHHSVHDVAGLGDVYLKLAAELGVPVRRGRVAALAEHRRAYGVDGPDVVMSGWTGRGLGVEGLKACLLEGLVGDGVVGELVVHPGYSDEGLRAISSLADAREDDLTDLMRLHAEGWLETQGIALVGYAGAWWK